MRNIFQPASSDKSRILFNSIIVTGGTVIEKIVFFIVSIVIARYLSVEHYGEYSTALGYATFFSVFTDLGMNVTLLRVINLDPEKKNHYYANSLVIKAVISLMIYGVMALSLHFTNYNHDTVLLTLILGLVRFGNEFHKTYYAFFDAEEKFFTTSLINLAYSILFLVGTVAVVFMKGNYYYIALVRLLFIIMILELLIIYTRRFYRFEFRRDLLASFLRSMVPFFFYIVFYTVLLRINVIILSLMKGTLYAGYFTNGYIFFISLTFIPTNFNRILVPYLYKTSFSEDPQKFQFTFDVFSKFFGILSFYTMTVLYLYAEEIILIIFGDKYLNSAGVLRIMSFCIPLLFNIATILITALDRQKYNTRFIGVATGVNIAANFILIHYLRESGAALAMVIAYVIIFLLSHYYLFRKKYIRLSRSVVTFFSLGCLAGACFFIHTFLLSGVFWGLSFVAVSVFFGLVSALVIMRPDDFRVIKKTLRPESKK